MGMTNGHVAVAMAGVCGSGDSNRPYGQRRAWAPGGATGPEVPARARKFLRELGVVLWFELV